MPALSNDEISARCRDCGTELKQDDKQCRRCSSTRKDCYVRIVAELRLAASTKLKHIRKGIGTLRKAMSNRWKRSGDPKLKDGVREDMVIDIEGNEYHHITRDARTGEITHEEHEKLTEHNRRGR